MEIKGKTQAELDAELAIAVKTDRTKRIESIAWRRDRYRDQLDAGVATTDTAETYAAILTYIQALRDVPAQVGFPTSVAWPQEVP
jgi:hypothetical protein